MKTLKQLQESMVPADQQGKQKPYVSSDGKGNFEVLGNKGQTKQTFTRKEHGAMARDKAREHLRKKYNEYMDEEVKREDPPFDGPYTKSKPVKNSDGTMQSPMSRARELAKKSIPNQKRMSEAKDEKEYGYEGDMAMNQLSTLIRCGEMIKDILKPDTDLPEWVQSKITLATDYIVTAADYLHSEMNEAAKPGLYANINAKRKRIEAGSNERMRKPGSEGAPSASDFKDAAKTANEEFEQIDELSKTTLGSYVKKASNDMANKGAALGKKQADGDEVDRYTNRHMTGQDAARETMRNAVGAGYADINKVRSSAVKRNKNIGKAVDRLTKEEVESIDEVNNREYASQGKMHPTMAKNMTVGQTMDYYEPKTGDKVSGKVTHNNGKEVHVKQTHDSYDSKKVGSVHKFTVSTKLDEGKGMKEELKGDQHKIDVNKNGKLDKFDFDKLRARRKQMQEKMNLSTADMGDVVKDFQKSDAPQFDGKSEKKRQQMAVAAKLEADRKSMKEEFQGFSSFLKVHEDIAEEIIEEGMISYGDFNDKMAAHKKAGNRILDYKHGEKSAHYVVVDKEGTKRKVTYTDRGQKMENMGGSTDKEKPATPAEKRGRGRPKGSASGARLKGSAKDNDDDSGLDDTRYSVHLPSGRR